MHAHDQENLEVLPAVDLESFEPRLFMRVEGVDVSLFQGAINWQTLRANNKEFAFVRSSRTNLDLDHNGLHDPDADRDERVNISAGDAFLEDYTVFIDADKDGHLDAGERRAQTTSDGFVACLGRRRIPARTVATLPRSGRGRLVGRR
jgi:hypothetical protein